MLINCLVTVGINHMGSSSRPVLAGLGLVQGKPSSQKVYRHRYEGVELKDCMVSWALSHIDVSEPSGTSFGFVDMGFCTLSDLSSVLRSSLPSV